MQPFHKQSGSVAGPSLRDPEKTRADGAARVHHVVERTTDVRRKTHAKEAGELLPAEVAGQGAAAAKPPWSPRSTTAAFSFANAFGLARKLSLHFTTFRWRPLLNCCFLASQDAVREPEQVARLPKLQHQLCLLPWLCPPFAAPGPSTIGDHAQAWPRTAVVRAEPQSERKNCWLSVGQDKDSLEPATLTCDRVLNPTCLRDPAILSCRRWCV